MRSNKLTRLVSAGLVVTMLLAQAACAKEDTSKKVTIEPMEPEESYALSFDILGGKDVMPVGGFDGPYSGRNHSPNAQPLPDFFTEEYMKTFAECGVNLILYAEDDYATEKGQKLLDFGEKYGVGIFINDNSICNMRGKDEKLSVELLSEKVAKYRNHPAFCGLYLVDEPGGKTYWTKDAGNNMEDYTNLSGILRNDLGLELYENLITINSKSQEGQYEGYLEEYCETMHPSYISFDHYVWDEGGTKNLFLYNTAIVREYAQKYKLPFWTYIAAGSNWSMTGIETENNTPTEGQFDWSINASLALGAQGIEYFMLIQPFYFAYTPEPNVFDFERNGLLGARGNKNRWYYYAQDISKQISAIDHVLMNSVSKGVIASGEDAKMDISGARDVMIKEDSWRELAGVEGDAIVGCFNYQGKTALYVVNYDETYAQDITLNFYDKYKMQVIQAGETKYVQADKLTLNMEAGDGILIVVQ